MELMDEGRRRRRRRRREEGEERSVYEGPNLKLEEGKVHPALLILTDPQERKRGSDVCARRRPSQSGRERFEI
jgi:hypothetical protein